MTDLQQLETKYRIAAEIIGSIEARKSTLRKSMSGLPRHLTDSEKKAIYALAVKAVQNKKAIDEMVKFCTKKSPAILNEPLLRILIAKLIFERKPAHWSLPKGIIETTFVLENRKELVSMKKKEPSDNRRTFIYLRVNKLKAEMSEVIAVLTENKFPENTAQSDSFESFVTNCGALYQAGFMRDYHFPEELLVFRSFATKFLISLDMYKQGKVIIQDKASFLTVKAMNLQPGAKVLDVCCAPGTKTAAMAADMGNVGSIISIDRDSNRLKEMRDLMKTLGVTCCDIIQGDFIELASNYTDTEFDVLLLDPSCSGSGRPDMSQDKVSLQRIGRLAGFQTKILESAFSLNAKKIIYSTCSVEMFENEVVIATALKESAEAANYTIVNPLPDWPYRSKSSYPFANDVIKSNQDLLTRGFFFCLFQRNDTLTKSAKSKFNANQEQN